MNRKHFTRSCLFETVCCINCFLKLIFVIGLLELLGLLKVFCLLEANQLLPKQNVLSM